MRPVPDGRLPDLVGGGLLTVLGAVTAVASVRYGLFGEGSRLAPGFMPFLSASALALLGAGIAARALRPAHPTGQPTRGAAADPGGARQDAADALAPAATTGRHARTVVVVFALCGVAILLTPLLGFLLAFGLLVLVLVVAVERRGVLAGVALALAATIGVWLVFEQFLVVPLPIGVLGI